MARSSVREYAILYVGGKRVAGGGTASGGNVLLNAGQHAHDGPEHTGSLPAEDVSVEDALDYFAGVDVEAVLAELSERIDSLALGGGGGGGLLAAASVDLAADVTETSSTPSSVDAGLVLSFTAPASGRVVVTFSGVFVGTSGYDYFWVVLESAASLGEAAITTDGSEHYVTARVLVEGLDPGDHVFEWAHRTDGDGSMTLVDYGKPVFTVEAVPADLLVLPLIDQAAEALAPEIELQSVIGLALIDQTATLAGPTVVLEDQGVTLALLDQTATLAAPTVARQEVIALSLLDRTAVATAPTVESDFVIGVHGKDAVGGSSFTSRNITLSGTPTAGRVLVGHAIYDRGIGSTHVGFPAGWTDLYHVDTNIGGACCVRAAYKTVVSETSTITLSFGSAVGWGDCTIQEVGGGTLQTGNVQTNTGSSSSHSIPALTPTASSHAMLIAMTIDKDPHGITAYPANYTKVEEAAAGGDARAVSYYREIASASGSYSDSYTLSGSTTYRNMQIVFEM